ncbi:hypothetical protein EDD85DRAFT_98424 [Armillaria nabsnona]|nr:hypothetical protein EDD85DRAFT_98424 [Armillaria nabsnona]
MRWRPTGAGASSHSSMMHGFQRSFTTFLGIFERDRMDRVLCTTDCRTCWAKPKGQSSTANHGPWFGDIRPTTATSLHHALGLRMLTYPAKPQEMSCCEALSVWVRCLDKPKLVIIALWAIRAMLNHPARIHFSHSCSYCVGHERHYAFMPHVLFFGAIFLLLSHHIDASSSSEEEPVVLKLCFTGRSSSYRDTYVVKERRQLFNTTENPISTHCRFAPKMITPHSPPATVAGRRFTALRDCLRPIAPVELS